LDIVIRNRASEYIEKQSREKGSVLVARSWIVCLSGTAEKAFPINAFAQGTMFSRIGMNRSFADSEVGHVSIQLVRLAVGPNGTPSRSFSKNKDPKPLVF